MSTNCSGFRRVNTAAIENMFLPLEGWLAETDVQFVGFGERLEKAARRAIAGDPDSIEIASMPSRLQLDRFVLAMANKDVDGE